MNSQFIIEEHPADPEWTRMTERARRNLVWFGEHAVELEVFKRYRGRFLAASEGELFVGDSREEVERLAREKHPGDVPHIHYIPREKAYRIYACRRPVVSL
jgi:hypothetical protein